MAHMQVVGQEVVHMQVAGQEVVRILAVHIQELLQGGLGLEEVANTQEEHMPEAELGQKKKRLLQQACRMNCKILRRRPVWSHSSSRRPFFYRLRLPLRDFWEA